MSRYVEWDDCVSRYSELGTLSGADEMGPAYIDYAEAYVDGLLSSHFTPPFSNNNMTVKDLVIDTVFYRAGRNKLENAAEVQSDTMGTIKMLLNGSMRMISTSGEILNTEVAGRIWSSTQSYHSAFGVKPVGEWHIDEDNIDDERID